jgi:hypothetical protein
MIVGGAKKAKKTSPRKARSASPKKAKRAVAKKTKSASPKKAKRAVSKKAKSTSPKKTKRSASPKKAKKSKGKRPLNPYMKFVKATRASVVKANPKAAITEIAKKLGQMWRKMTDGEKAKYK